MAYHVLCHSILSRSSRPVRFIPINKRNIPVFTRGIEDGSTEFSFSRFLTPYLHNYEGRALFLDSDMLVLDDIAKLFDSCDKNHDVFCVQHDYTPKTKIKFLGNKQEAYPRKNWSSVMLFNNARCMDLTPERVNTASGAYLHRMHWAGSVGEISARWNFLVGEYEPIPVNDISLLHYTLGAPCFKEYQDCDYAEQWFNELQSMNYAYEEQYADFG